MFEFLHTQIDYIAFSLICFAAAGAITLLIRRSGRSDRAMVAAWILIPLILIPGWFAVNSEGNSERRRLRTRIEGLAPTYAAELTSMGHSAITPATDPNDPAYLAMIEKEISWLELNHAVADIYTFRLHPDGNALIVDSETDYDRNGIYEEPRETRTAIGEVWEEKNERLELAYSGMPAFDDIPYSDRWGTWVSAYVPMWDENGRLEAILGVDFPAEDWVHAIARARFAVIGFLAVILTTLLGSISIITVLRANLDERRRSEAALRKARDAAELATKAKSEFLANMSHEIRTPMNGILGMTELLLGTDLSPQQREFQVLVQHSAESLLTVLNDVLDFSKIEAGKLELENRNFDLRDAIGDTLHALGFTAGERGLELAYQIEPDVPDCLIGDPGRLRQILVNLVGNALKFTEQGEVVVRIAVESLADDRVTLRVSVRDTGIGIAPEKTDAVFESFTQADSATTRTFGGTGLGLAISSQLVRLMNGRIWVESEPGKGSHFHFTAQFGIGAVQPGSTRLMAEHLHGLRVLVVDDHETNRRILDETLKRSKMEPILARGGAEALEKLTAAAGGENEIQLILLDMMMPEMDGEEVARRVKEQLGEKAPAIIMLSSAGRLLGEQEMAELGVARVLTKPAKPSELRNAIGRLFSDSPAGSDAAGEAEEAWVRTGDSAPLKLLLAEDGHVNQVVATRLLEKLGHQVVIANNGREAIEALGRDAFDAVLMDVQMPEMDGYDATRNIRRNEEKTGAHIPIIAMTANAMTGDREKCLESGMDDYIAKPVRFDELVDALERLVKNR